MSAPETPNRTAMLAMTVIAVAAITAGTVLSMAGRPITDLLALFGVAILPVFTYLGARIHSGVQETKTLANGNNQALRDAVIQLAGAKVTPPPAEIVPTDTP